MAVLGLSYLAHAAVSVSSLWDSIDRVSLGEESAHHATGHTTVPASSPTEPAGGDDPEAAPEDGGTPAPTTSLPPAAEIAPSTPATDPPDSTPGTVPASPHKTTTTSWEEPSTTTTRAVEEAPEAAVLVGSDSRSDLDDLTDFGDFAGQRADVIVLALRHDEAATLLSIPRDLYVEDLCLGGRHRIGDAYRRCGDRSRLANLVQELERLVGVDIQHAAAVDLAGFHSVVDALGGYEICTDHPLRDPKSGLKLEAGCTVADGETTLQWLRSRHTQQLRDGTWELVPGVSDLDRNRRQRVFLEAILNRLTRRSGPGAIREALGVIAPHLTIDDQLTIGDAARWIWRFRGSELDTEEIPVRPETTSGGAEVLVPDVEVSEYVEELSSG